MYPGNKKEARFRVNITELGKLRINLSNIRGTDYSKDQSIYRQRKQWIHENEENLVMFYPCSHPHQQTQKCNNIVDTLTRETNAVSHICLFTKEWICEFVNNWLDSFIGSIQGNHHS